MNQEREMCVQKILAALYAYADAIRRDQIEKDAELLSKKLWGDMPTTFAKAYGSAAKDILAQLADKGEAK